MAIIYSGLRTGFQALIESVERGDALPIVQKKQRALLLLSQVAQQLNILDRERAESLRLLEQLDVQNTITTVGRLLKLQRQLNDAVVKDLTGQLDNTHLALTHLENVFSKKAIIDQETIGLLQRQHLELEDLEGKRFGSASWQKYFGDVGVEPPLPLDIHTILESPCPFWPDKKVKETHLLTLIPATVNGQPLTLNIFEQLIQNPKEGHKTLYHTYWQKLREMRGDVPIQHSHWVLIPRDLIPSSRYQTYADQQLLMTQYPHYQVAQTLEVAVCVVMEYVVSGNHLFGDLTRCEENIDGTGIVVGRFGLQGLCISFSKDNWQLFGYGMAPVRRL